MLHLEVILQRESSMCIKTHVGKLRQTVHFVLFCFSYSFLFQNTSRSQSGTSLRYVVYLRVLKPQDSIYSDIFNVGTEFYILSSFFGWVMVTFETQGLGLQKPYISGVKQVWDPMALNISSNSPFEHQLRLHLLISSKYTLLNRPRWIFRCANQIFELFGP